MAASYKDVMFSLRAAVLNVTYRRKLCGYLSARCSLATGCGSVRPSRSVPYFEYCVTLYPMHSVHRTVSDCTQNTTILPVFTADFSTF